MLTFHDCNPPPLPLFRSLVENLDCADGCSGHGTRRLGGLQGDSVIPSRSPSTYDWWLYCPPISIKPGPRRFGAFQRHLLVRPMERLNSLGRLRICKSYKTSCRAGKASPLRKAQHNTRYHDPCSTGVYSQRPDSSFDVGAGSICLGSIVNASYFSNTWREHDIFICTISLTHIARQLGCSIMGHRRIDGQVVHRRHEVGQYKLKPTGPFILVFYLE